MLSDNANILKPETCHLIPKIRREKWRFPCLFEKIYLM